MTGAGDSEDGQAGRMDFAPAPVSAAPPNPVRARLELALKTLESLRQPTVEQIERKQFLKEYLSRKF